MTATDSALSVRHDVLDVGIKGRVCIPEGYWPVGDKGDTEIREVEFSCRPREGIRFSALYSISRTKSGEWTKSKPRFYSLAKDVPAEVQEFVEAHVLSMLTVWANATREG